MGFGTQQQYSSQQAWWNSLPDSSAFGASKSNTPNPATGQTGTGGANASSSSSVAGLQQQQLNNFNNLNPNVIPNPQTNAAQMAALGQYGTLASSGGMDPQAIAQLQQAMQQSNIQQQGQQGAISQQQQQQGGLGSGQAFAQRLSAQQGGANSSALAATQAASDARNRTLSALGSYAGLAGNIGQQQFGQAQQNYGNAFNLANAKNNVLGGFQNILTNQQNQNAQQLQNGLQTGLGAVQGAINYGSNQGATPQNGYAGYGSGGGYGYLNSDFNEYPGTSNPPLVGYP